MEQLVLFAIEKPVSEQSVEEKAIEFTALHILRCAGCREIVKRLLSEGKVEQAYKEFKNGSSNFGFAIGDICYTGYRHEIKIRDHDWFTVKPRELFEIVKEHHKSVKEDSHE
jgi:hypothetical protein